MPDKNQEKVKSLYNSRALTYTSFINNFFLLAAVKKSEKKAMRSLLKNIEGHDVLEVGCGTGFYTELLLKMNAAKIFALDISSEMLKQLPSSDKITPVCANAENFNLDRKFDVLMNSGATEFVKEPIKVFQTLRAHSNTNAILYLHIANKSITCRLLKFYYGLRGISFNLFSDKMIQEYAKKANWAVEAKTGNIFKSSSIYRLKAV
ncbi:MAG: class I SAM-dependent methyltransferase [Elusimicrobia bacterium]|nr:class I SAM-dependent methyltransferase [Elusimicrobiota bacterium]